MFDNNPNTYQRGNRYQTVQQNHQYNTRRQPQSYGPQNNNYDDNNQYGRRGDSRGQNRSQMDSRNGGRRNGHPQNVGGGRAPAQLDHKQSAQAEELREAMMRIYATRHQDPIYTDRQKLKNEIQGPLNFLIGNVIGQDQKYTNQMGMISRSYRGAGTFSNAEFDMHVPLNTPDAGMLQFEEHRLPVVAINMQSSGHRGGSGGWTQCVANGNLSAEKIKLEMRDKLTKEAKEWNDINREYGTFQVQEMRANQPIHLEFTMPSDNRDQRQQQQQRGQTVVISVTPVMFARGLRNSDALTQKLMSDRKSWPWPEDMDFRRHLAEQALLIPKGAAWGVSMLIAHKIMVGNFDDDGLTFRDPLYRSLKTLNKKIFNSPNDHEAIKIGSYILLQVYLDQLSRSQDYNDWNNDAKLLERLKSILADWRNRLAVGESGEYALPGRVNALHSYKSSSFLNPTLAGLVRKLEQTQKDPVHAMNTAAKVSTQSGAANARGQGGQQRGGPYRRPNSGAGFYESINNDRR